ncbi:MAG: ATP-binding protein [Halobacteriota archaeon]
MVFIETLKIDSDELSEQFLLDFIEVGREEGKTIDYKDSFRFMPHGTCKPTWYNPEKDRLEFLKDVSSFANTSGGVILYGIEEKGGIP